MSTSLARLLSQKRPVPTELTQRPDDPERLTMGDIGPAAVELPNVRAMNESLTPGWVVLHREDGARLDVAFRFDAETIIGWAWCTGDMLYKVDAQGSLDGLFDLIESWAAKCLKDDLPVLTQPLIGHDATVSYLYWKPARKVVLEDFVETAWDSPFLPPASLSVTGGKEVLTPEMRFFSDGDSVIAQRVENITKLTPGTFTVVGDHTQMTLW